MTTTRREFVKAAAMGAVASVACPAALAQVGRIGESTEWVRSVCRFCGTGCGVRLAVRDGRLLGLRGDVEHPTTKGLVCAKALFLPKIVYAEDRLTRPLIRRDGALNEATWDEAMALVAETFAAAIRDHGPDSVAYYGSGQCLSEESYFMSRLFKGGIGTNNVEANVRAATVSAAEGYLGTYGADGPMGCYDDIDHASVFFLLGSNTAECHPVLFDRIMARKQATRGVSVIVCDPRKMPTMTIADVHVNPQPGADLAVLHSMAQVIVRENKCDLSFIERNVQFRIVKDGLAGTVSFDDYRKFLDTFAPEKIGQAVGVDARLIIEAAHLFAGGPTMSLWAMGINQRTTGVHANQLIHNLHLITGQIGRPGATPLALAGQGNAYGGVHDTGALCDLLPCGRKVTDADDRAEIESLWGSKPGTIASAPGLGTVELFKALAAEKIRALFITTTNPAHSLPNASQFCNAMEEQGDNRPFIVVLDAFPTKTTELADVVLPAAIWSEKAGVFGMSERRYQYLARIQDPPGEAREDLRVMMDFAARLEQARVVPEGYSAKLKSADDVWEEMRAASRGTLHDFSGMTRQRLKDEHGLRWPCPTESHAGTARRYVKGEDPLLDEGPHADAALPAGDVKFYAAPDQKAIVWLHGDEAPAESTDTEYPFLLSTGRVLELWDSNSMTVRASELRRAQPVCFIEIHPVDARKLGVRTGDPVRITSRRGEALIRARVAEVPRPGMVFVPWHWEGQNSLINRVTNDACDPVSLQPELKICAVRLSKA